MKVTLEATMKGPWNTRVDAGRWILFPGFIDLHVHGAVGYEVMDADPEGLRAMARYFAAHGVTGFP